MLAMEQCLLLLQRIHQFESSTIHCKFHTALIKQVKQVVWLAQAQSIIILTYIVIQALMIAVVVIGVVKAASKDACRHAEQKAMIIIVKMTILSSSTLQTRVEIRCLFILVYVRV